MDGLLVVDKAAGPTSHDIVARVRRVLGQSRIGHTGTLDPMASGVLPLVLGRATRLARFVSAGDKTYEAEIRFGVATDTYDAQGLQTAEHRGPMPLIDDIDRALDAFRGTFMQQPPAYSAKKIGGKRSYTLARDARLKRRAACDVTDRRDSLDAPALASPVSVRAHAIEIMRDVADRHDRHDRHDRRDPPDRREGRDRIVVRVECSAGFYVRSLAHDLGQRLGVGAHLVALRRTRSGGFTLADAIAIASLELDPSMALNAVVPLAAMLPGLSSAILTEAGERRVARGLDLGAGDVWERRGAGEPGSTPGIRLIDRRGDLLGIAEEAGTSGVLHPSVVLI
jgi:tRNA pseudouridine55 synthase